MEAKEGKGPSREFGGKARDFGGRRSRFGGQKADFVKERYLEEVEFVPIRADKVQR